MQTPAQKAFWDSIPNNTELTPALALQSGYTQDAKGRWINPEGHAHWTGKLGKKQSWGSTLKSVAKDTALLAGIAVSGGAAAGLAGAGGAAAATGGGAAASTVAPAAAASSTLVKALPYLAAGGKTLSAIEAARNNNRAVDTANNQIGDQQETARYNAGLNAAQVDLQQRQYLDTKMARDQTDAVHGGYLQGMRDMSISSPSQVPRSTVTGGMRPSAITNADQIGKAMQQRAIASMLNPTKPGGSFDASGAVTGGGSDRMMTLPYLKPISAIPQSNGVDTALGIGDLIGAGSSLASQYMQPNTGAAANPATTATPVVLPDFVNGAIDPRTVGRGVRFGQRF